MKKKIVCLLLCLAMVLPLSLFGCSSSDDDLDLDVSETTREAKTLTFWIVTDEATTAEEQAKMESAFNAVCEKDYTTHVKFVFCTEDEYESTLDSYLAAAKKNKDGDNKNNSTSGKTESSTYQDDLGMTYVRYPDVKEGQMDIVLIMSRSMLERYVTAGYLTSLDSSINDDYRSIQKYVYQDVLQNSKIDGSWYAVPNNKLIGQFTYMLVNREIASSPAYSYTAEDFTEFGYGTTVAKFIDQLAADENYKGTVAPMAGMVTGYPLAKYWSAQSGTQSTLATMYISPTELAAPGTNVSNVFADSNFQSYMKELFYCKENDYFLKEGQTEFGVAIVEGDYASYEEHVRSGKYYVSILGYPRLEDEDIFNGMFAVTNYTVDLSRSMEIINALTCQSELRNILQYGVEGVHYEVEDGVVHRLAAGAQYQMNINYTGNVWMAYMDDTMSGVEQWATVRENYIEEHSTETIQRDLGVWTAGILQNQRSMLSKVCGSAAYLGEVDAAAMQAMQELSEAYFARLYACETVSEFEAYVASITREIVASDYYQTLVSNSSKDGKFNMSSLKGALEQWNSDAFAES